MKIFTQSLFSRMNILQLLLLCCVCTSFSYPLNGSEVLSYEIHDSFENEYTVVSDNEFYAKYGHIKWMHIGRLQKLNPNIDLKKIRVNSKFSDLKFAHGLASMFAYKLYDGTFLIVKKSN